MYGAFFKCKSKVYIEGIDIGPFTSFELSGDRDSIENTASLTLPIYTISVDDTGTAPGQALPQESRVRVGIPVDLFITGARIDVDVWYDRSDFGEELPVIRAFTGYISQVVAGFPTTIKCQDNSFVLRFGNVGKNWNPNSTLKNIVNFCLPISNDAFAKYRQEKGLTYEWTPLTFAKSATADASFTLAEWYDISPYDALSRLMRLFKIYGNVNDDGSVYFGVGISDTDDPTVILRTDLNVIDCDIVPNNKFFTNYYVKINGLDRQGKRISYEIGDSQGETKNLKFSPLNTLEGIQRTAQTVFERLKGDRNKGTITTLLYPWVNLFDFCQFTHTLFPSLSGNYYVIGKTLTCDEGGYRQKLTVTDEQFIF